MSYVRLSFAGAVLVSGCRGLLGIEEVTVVDDADGSTSGDAQASSEASTDASGPPGDSGAPPENPPDASACRAKIGGECSMCCKNSFKEQVPVMEGVLVQTGCICGTGLCTAECSTTICASAPPAQGCGQCIDTALQNGGAKCKDALDSCRNQPQSGCKEVASCMEACR